MPTTGTTTRTHVALRVSGWPIREEATRIRVGTNDGIDGPMKHYATVTLDHHNVALSHHDPAAMEWLATLLFQAADRLRGEIAKAEA